MPKLQYNELHSNSICKHLQSQLREIWNFETGHELKMEHLKEIVKNKKRHLKRSGWQEKV